MVQAPAQAAPAARTPVVVMPAGQGEHAAAPATE
jgi:hypothetical protein